MSSLSGNLLGTVGLAARYLGDKLQSYGKSNNRNYDNVYNTYVDSKPKQVWKMPTGLNIPLTNPALLKVAELKEEWTDNMKNKALTAGRMLSRTGQSYQPREQQMKEFYINNLPLSDIGKKMLRNSVITFPKDEVSFANEINSPMISGVLGTATSMTTSLDPLKYINVSQKSARYPGTYRDVLMHELAHRVDTNGLISKDYKFLKALDTEITNNPYFGEYINTRRKTYGTRISPSELYAFTNEYLYNKRGKVSRDLLGYFPQYNKELLLSSVETEDSKNIAARLLMDQMNESIKAMEERARIGDRKSN